MPYVIHMLAARIILCMVGMLAGFIWTSPYRLLGRNHYVRRTTEQVGVSNTTRRTRDSNKCFSFTPFPGIY